MDIGSDVVGIRTIAMNVGNNGVGVRNFMKNISIGSICVGLKLGLQARDQQ